VEAGGKGEKEHQPKGGFRKGYNEEKTLIIDRTNVPSMEKKEKDESMRRNSKRENG